MTASKKNVSIIVLLSAFIIVILFFSVIYPINSENTNIYSKETIISQEPKDTVILQLKEDRKKLCNSSTGFCGPPAGWYPTN